MVKNEERMGLHRHNNAKIATTSTTVKTKNKYEIK